VIQWNYKLPGVMDRMVGVDELSWR
jgi:hypothetical protein